MARISTHVLNLAEGRPVEGMQIELFRGSQLVQAARTNADGRTECPLLEAERLSTGGYEIHFRTGGFFDVITVRFVVSEEHGNYHIPLLLSPFGYSTYRGS